MVDGGWRRHERDARASRSGRWMEKARAGRSRQRGRQLKKQKTEISMAAAGNCYENALAERVNGILK
ncbi:hypothetical protein K8089_13810, partial [Aequorivita sp. F47161]|nr:hypothetical protein [Aequorivita vitellina]